MKIHSRVKDYELVVVKDVLSFGKELYTPVKHSRRFYFVDERFYQLYQARLDPFIGTDFKCIIPANELNKEYVKLADYFSILVDAGFTRSDVLITFGGGVLQDISGFIASTLYRGIKWIFLPTTLLAQADSCIGSKTSINFKDSKNLIGTFYPPDLILVDLAFTRTLNPSEFNSGLGEIIKFHLLSDVRRCATLKKFLSDGNLAVSQLFDEVIAATLDIKRSYFEADEFDIGRRNLLNYGHCFGHALESASAFGISHGEAVLVGMGIANIVALKRGLLSAQNYDVLESFIKPYYPAFDLGCVTVDDLIMYLKRDKKRAGPALTMIMGSGIGDFFKFDDVSEDEIKGAVRQFKNSYQQSR